MKRRFGGAARREAWCLCGFLASLAVVSLVVLSGCGTHEGPLQPAGTVGTVPPQVSMPRSSTDGGTTADPNPESSSIGLGQATRTLVYAWADRVTTIKAGLWVLEIPPYALDRSRVVGLWSISRWTVGLPENLGVECEIDPAGLIMSVPPTLTFVYQQAGLVGIDPRDLRIYGLNTAEGVWEEMPSRLDPLTGCVSATAGSDSRYALGVARTS